MTVHPRDGGAPDGVGPDPSDAVLALVGPTATGKSDTAVDVAVAAGGVEIVAVDAFTVYRGMDVGTAKPGPRERGGVPHHMIDVLDPWEEVSVAWFQRRAREAIDDVLARDRVPLLVGGSGLYFRAVVDDLHFPPTDPAVRSRLRERFHDDPPAAHAALADRDPAAAARIEPGNLRRSVRALEVIEITGRRFSAYHDAWDDYTSVYPGLRVRGIDLPDDVLRGRIEKRAQAMVERGLLAEAAALRRLPRPLSRTARQGIGYREAFAVHDGEMDEGNLAASIAARTWRYARRQRSWFQRDPRITWSTADDVTSAWT